MSRITRKDEHIFIALKLAERPVESAFNDVSLVHNALPEIAWQDIDLKTELFGKKLAAPLVINAITGGGNVPAKINEALAIAAREAGLAMAVGSQKVAIEIPECEQSFRIVRKVNPNGLVMANVGANVSPDVAQKCIDMISADALQVHLNVPQETVMKEGDRDFRGCLKNIGNIIRQIQVPVVVKEVGFGLSREVAKRLSEVGVDNFDVGGRGGTNFITIEDLRNQCNQNFLESWGISTVSSLLEIVDSQIASTVIATGGLRNGLHAAKALALGAKMVGLAGVCLKVVFDHKVEGLVERLESLKRDLKKVMLMAGVRQPEQLQKVPVVITGKTREWLTERGIDTTKYARRKCW